MRRKLTDQQMLKGVKKALASPKTPSHFKAGLRRLQQTLESKIERRKRGGKSWLDEFF